MIYNKEIALDIAGKLLKIKAVKLNSKQPFTWASGIISPIYCDNRKILSYIEERNFIKNKFAEIVKEKYSDIDVIAGVATGAIAIGALVADVLQLPFIYVRSSKKDHGLQNKIEGEITKGQKVLVIEDLVSTGGSSINAVEALRNAELNVVGMLAIYSYNLPVTLENFKKANCDLTTLTDYETTVNIALENDYIQKNEYNALIEWRKDPENWLK
ncbi:MAG: orotate phosphoribosyltransferase [Bacteroidales bacterium]|jgi:orotate phosphoribosyltransferase